MLRYPLKFDRVFLSDLPCGVILGGRGVVLGKQLVAARDGCSKALQVHGVATERLLRLDVDSLCMEKGVM